MIRITSKRDGFYRCGIPHLAKATDYADDRFTEEELTILKAETMLSVKRFPGKPKDPTPIPSPLGGEGSEQLAEREAALAEKETFMVEREKALSEKETFMAERIAAAAKREGSVETREKKLQEREAAVAKKESSLAGKEGKGGKDGKK